MMVSTSYVIDDYRFRMEMMLRRMHKSRRRQARVKEELPGGAMSRGDPGLRRRVDEVGFIWFWSWYRT